MVPKYGMGQLSEHLAKQLSSSTLCYKTRVESLSKDRIHCQDGRTVVAKAVLDARSLASVSSDVETVALRCLYFSANQSPLKRRKLFLNGSGKGAINHVAVMSDISPSYAPDDKALISVTLLGDMAERGIG